ncbi:MAG: hypothetical protein HYZ67_05160, partial [Chlamydiae bacterium]|nr:hypothetical protein [Chlamydiota bacterium]
YPAVPSEFFGNILEIGPGRGDLLLSHAEQVPQKKIVAIEISKKRFLKIIQKIFKKSLTNIQRGEILLEVLLEMDLLK